MKVKDIISQILSKKSQLRKFGVKKIGLFGSYLKGNFNDRSDIDFLVTFDRMDFDNYMELQYFLEKMFKKKIDLVIERNLIPELNYVKKEAKYVKL